MKAASDLTLAAALAVLASAFAGIALQTAHAAESPPAPTPTSALSPAAAEALPPLRFVGDPVGSDLYDRLRQVPLLKNLGRDIVGSPLQLRVYHTFTLTQGGKVSGTASGLLAAGTLGLVPQVYSGEHAMVYELVVNGAVLTSYTYHRILTRTHNLWSADATHGLGKEGQAWAESTVNEFLHDCAADPKLAELMAEYHYYFEAAH